MSNEIFSGETSLSIFWIIFLKPKFSPNIHLERRKIKSVHFKMSYLPIKCFESEWMHQVVETHEDPGDDLATPDPTKPRQPRQLSSICRVFMWDHHHKDGKKEVLREDNYVEDSLSDARGLMILSLHIFPQSTEDLYL